jgi:hypothetical protein
MSIASDEHGVVEVEESGGASTFTRVSRVINRAYVKSWALDYASTNRSHKFTRVSEEFLNAVEHATKAVIRDRIDRHPSKGTTLK